MWIKICANTSAEDALEAARLGADALGFVFAPSARQVHAEQVRAVTAQLPAGIERVGVFGALPPDEIGRMAAQAGLTAVQLHTTFDRTYAQAVRAHLDPQVAIIPVVHWHLDDTSAAVNVASALEQIAAWDPRSRVLLDTKVGTASGGTGQTFPWEQAADVLRSRGALRIIVAGGLRPENVAQAIALLQPWGVDVASGVERSPGHKDVTRLQAFLQHARASA